MAVVDLNLADIFEEAFEMAGESFHTARDIQIARRSLSFVMDEWANRGFNLWTIGQGTISLVVGTATYALPTDTIDIVDHVIRTTDGLTDYTIRRIAVGEYSQLTNKTTRSRPTTIYVERTVAPQVTLWPVPDDTYTLVYWRLRRLESISTGAGDGTASDVPSRFRPALAAGLAKRIAILKQKWDIVPAITMEYEDQWQKAAEEDRDRASYWATPHIGKVV